MQENQPLVPIADSLQTTEIEPAVDNRPKANSFLVILLSILLFTSCLIAGFFAFQTQQLVSELRVMRDELKQTPTLTSIPTYEPGLEPEPVPLEILTKDWKTYTNKIFNYTIKYPKDWKIDISKAELPISPENSQELKISNNGYILTIMWPSGYGPSLCLFDDQTRKDAPEFASFCEGKFIEIKNMNDLLSRRLEKPALNSAYASWSIYSQEKDSGYFVTVPPTSYQTPLNFDSKIILVMDQILSTYKSTN